MPLQPSTRPVFPRAETSRREWPRNIVGLPNRSKTLRWGCFYPISARLRHTLLDRELYLPRHWVEDGPRCKEAGIPETVRFHTKCELARKMMERLHQAQVSIDWVVADSVYGNNLDLRTWLEDQGYWHVLAKAPTEEVGIMTPDGPKLMTVKQAEQLLVKPQDWQRLSVRTGTKGPLFFDWACLPILHRWQDDKRHWVLIRRIPNDPTEKTYYLVFGPVGTTLEVMVKAIGARWHIEEEFENGKDIGLDHYEVRSFVGWFRHMTLVLLVLAMLTVVCAKERLAPAASGSNHTPPLPIPLTVPEVRRLLGRLLFPLSRSAPAVLARELVASMSTRKRQRLSCQASPQLELILGHTRFSETKTWF